MRGIGGLLYAWSPQYIPDLTGKVRDCAVCVRSTCSPLSHKRSAPQTYVITGGSSGVGLEVTRALLRRGARVIIASRSRERVDAAIGTLKALLPSADVLGMEVNLASFRRVRRLACALRVCPGS